jgi:hypothetical protein
MAATRYTAAAEAATYASFTGHGRSRGPAGASLWFVIATNLVALGGR